MRDFFREEEESVIIEDEKYLLPSYLPDEVLFRDREMEAIAASIRPFLRGKGGRHVYVFGPSGCGKTTSIKYLSLQASRLFGVVCAYVNCWENYTAMAVLNKIVESLKLPLPRRGLAVDEMFSRLLHFIKHEKKRVVVFLDDVEGLKQHSLIALLLKANESSSHFLLVTVAQSREWLASLDARIRSMLSPYEVPFAPYNEEQRFEILRQRAYLALRKGSFSEQLLRKIARYGTSARDCIERLRAAAKKAEERGKAKIEIQDLEDSAPTYFDVFLSEEERFIVSLLQSGPQSTHAIYTAFSQFKKLTKRQIRNYLALLEEKGVVKSREEKSTKRIKPKTYFLVAGYEKGGFDNK